MTEEKKSKLEEAIEKLVEEWEKESFFTELVEVEYKRIPFLHNKYWSRAKKLGRKIFEATKAYEDMEFKKHLYYTGRGTPEEYKANPQNYTIPKGELPLWMKQDKELKNAKFQIDCMKEIEKVYNEIISQINERHWKLRGILDAEKFRSGIG
jgi:hypothetical protein